MAEKNFEKDGVKYRICSKCLETKPLREAYAKRSNTTYSAMCKQCVRVREKELLKERMQDLGE